MTNDFSIIKLLEGENINYEELLTLLFLDYHKKQKSGKIYEKESLIPQNLIKLYYTYIDDPKFDPIISNFKEKYINNESKLEQVHCQEEVNGLGEVYEHINKYIEKNSINVYIILRLHKLLYSRTKHPEFGGSIRNMNVFLPYTGMDLADWSEIPTRLQELYAPINDLVKLGISLGKEKKLDDIIPFINKCVEINCKLIKIHPFFDGNGRTIRAFTNLLFKLANIPPIYIKPTERKEYEKAMSKALGENDYLAIYQFYYYKICDSIVELDINYREEKMKSR